MRNLMKWFVWDEAGLELSEYAIMAGIIIVLAVATIVAIGGHINNIFTQVSAAMGEAETGTGTT